MAIFKDTNNTIPSADSDPNPIPTPNPEQPEQPEPEQPEQPEQPEPEQPEQPEQPDPIKDKVDPQVIDALTIGMLNTIANSTSVGIAELFQHQINHARRLDSMNEAFIGQIQKKFANIDIIESISISNILKSESDSSIGSLLAQLSLGNEITKVAQSTPSDLAYEISKMGNSIASLHGLIGGIVAMLQATFKSTSGTNEPNIAPATFKVQNNTDDEYNASNWSSTERFPKVTIRY